MAHVCKQVDDISGLLKNNSNNLNIYKCGGCGMSFETICSLHEHMQGHNSGGSYYYDHTFLTAFPKYGNTCSGSQTDFNDNNIVQKISSGSQTELDLNHIFDLHSNIENDENSNSKMFLNEGLRKCVTLQKHRGESKMNVKKHFPETESDFTEITHSSDVSNYDDIAADEAHVTSEENMIEIDETEENNNDVVEHVSHIVKNGKACVPYQSQSEDELYNDLCNYSSIRKNRKNETGPSKRKRNQRRKNVEVFVNKNDILKCPICEKLFKSLPSFKRHLAVVHSDENMGIEIKTFKCKYCDFNFRNKKELMQHLKEDHNEADKMFSCTYCEVECLTNATRSAHMDSEHPEIVQVLKKFHESKDTDSPTTCDLCGKLFTTAAGLALHMSSIHLKKKFKCDICNVELSQKFTLKAHKIEKHHEDMRGFDCYICKKTFAYKFRLKAHIEQMHRPPEERDNQYICETCGYISSSKSGLTYHKTKHDEHRKQFQCSLCPYKTYYKCSLTEHMTSHEGKRRFICDVCGNKFFTSKQLKVHMRRHTGELPYQCETCSKRFRTDIAIARHRDIHLNKMRYKCDYCDKEFVQKTNCSAHMRQHTGEKPFKCDWCSNCFTHNVSRKAHMIKCVQKPPATCTSH